MIKNYLKVAFRAIVKNRLSSFINISGLAFALTSALLIYLYIVDEVSYDKYHAKADRIYRVTRDFLSPDGSVTLHLGHVAPPFGPLLENDFPEFETVARTLQSRFLLSYQENGSEKSFNEDNAFYAEPELFDIFSISLTEGNVDKSLRDPFTIMLSENTARKYFGDQSPVGKVFRVGNQFDVTVTGTFKDFPDQSHWHPTVLVAFSTLNDSTIYGREGLETNWGNNSFSTYILAKEQLNIPSIEKRFPEFIDKHMGAMASGNNAQMPSTWTNLYLQKLTDIHLRSHLDSEIEANGNITSVYMMAVIGVFIILIACFNFVNLSTARATKRAREVGLRKVVGAFRNQLIFQYLSESILVAVASLIACIGLSMMALPWLNDFTNKEIELNFMMQPLLALGLLIFTIFVGAIAGIYPAFVISGYKPALILKGQTSGGAGKSGLRKFLVVAQFSISIVLIIATIITFRQLEYLNSRELGYNRERVITLRHFNELTPSYDAFFNQLTSSATIQSAGRSSLIPTARLVNSQGSGSIQKGDSLMDTDIILKNINIDYHFFETYQIPIVAGRNFSPHMINDDSVSFILNEAAVKLIGEDVNNIISKDFQYGGIKGKIIGVVKDFHFESLHEQIVPVVFQARPFFSRISIKLAGNNLQEGIAHVEKVWKEFLPHRPFEFSFLSNQYQQLYEAEQRQAQLFTIFASLAIVIACLGLFGLATFNTLQRVKEIGVRKVLGASESHIVALLSKEIVILIIIANVIAWPLAAYMMDKWLDNFAYRIDFNIWIYLLSGVIAVAIGLFTVSFQTIKAAMANPAKTLKYE